MSDHVTECQDRKNVCNSQRFLNTQQNRTNNETGNESQVLLTSLTHVASGNVTALMTLN